MFCKNCGKQLEDEATFCKFCGAPQEHNTNQYEKDNTNIKDEETTVDGEDNEFTDPTTSSSEKTIAILRQSYFGSLTSDSGSQKNIIRLTEKWIHVKSRVLTPGYFRPMSDSSFITTDMIIPIRHVTGIEISSRSFVAKEIVSIVFLFLGAISIFLYNNTGSFEQTAQIIFICSAILFFALGIIQIIYVARFGKKILSIHHIGGPTRVLVRWYSRSELENFRSKVLECIEKIK
ncbi:MAG: zinc ribbon domain-containing protein [Bacteroidetes bacterium]|nr:zinc ribbon domain-containing protein [Bacteroidota bacterium]